MDVNFIKSIWLILYYFCRSIILLFIPKSLRYKQIVGENVVITGGGGGLGQRLALRFAKLGANVVVIDNEEIKVEKTKNLIEKQLGNCVVKTYVCNLTDRHLVYKTAEEITREVGFISILVNNAGVLYGKSILNLTDENIINTFNVNTLSNFWTIKAFLPQMLAKNKGHIVTIASICAKTGFVQMSDYCASKHAVFGLNDSLNYELLMQNQDNNQIKTTIVCPSFFNTPLIAGVQPSGGIHTNSVDYVADKAIGAILTDQDDIFIPHYFTYYFVLKSILPTKVFNEIYKLRGGFNVMTNFKGNQ